MKPINAECFLSAGIECRQKWAAVIKRAEDYMITITGKYLKLVKEKYQNSGENVDDYTEREEYPELLADLHDTRFSMLYDAEDFKDKLGSCGQKEG